jgi:hypothetical protein
MKANSFSVFLIGVLIVGALAMAGLSIMYVRSVKALQKLQLQSAYINQNRAIMRDLASEAVEYSKRNPGMEKVLESVGIRVRPANAQTNSAALKTNK